LGDERKKSEELQFSVDEAQFCGDEMNVRTSRNLDLKYTLTCFRQNRNYIRFENIILNTCFKCSKAYLVAFLDWLLSTF